MADEGEVEACNQAYLEDAIVHHSIEILTGFAADGEEFEHVAFSADMGLKEILGLLEYAKVLAVERFEIVDTP